MHTKKNLKIIVDGILIGTKHTGRDYKGAIVGTLTREQWHREKSGLEGIWGKKIYGNVTLYVLCRWMKNDGQKTKDHVDAITKRGKLQNVRYVPAA